MRYAESKSNGSFGKQVFHFFEEDQEDEKKNEH
jgi:hypothetical protein